MKQRTARSIDRAKALLQRERAFEIEMTARIISESAVIRSEWSDEVELSRRTVIFEPLDFSKPVMMNFSPKTNE